MIRYSGLYAPVDGAFEQVARMAALVFDAPIVAVNIADDARVWFPASEGPADGPGSRTGQSPSRHLWSGPAGPEPVIVDDALTDRRTSAHPWVTGAEGIRFLAVAPILPAGRQVGTLEVMDRKRHRRTSAAQIELLQGLAATVAQLLQVRITSLDGLRAERAVNAAETQRRDDAERLAAQQDQATAASRQRERPDWCQLGGERSCHEPAELKIADSWGDSAWGCWEHAEDALIQVPSSFLATESEQPGLDAYRQRQVRS